MADDEKKDEFIHPDLHLRGFLAGYNPSGEPRFETLTFTINTLDGPKKIKINSSGEDARTEADKSNPEFIDRNDPAAKAENKTINGMLEHALGNGSQPLQIVAPSTAVGPPDQRFALPDGL